MRLRNFEEAQLLRVGTGSQSCDICGTDSVQLLLGCAGGLGPSGVDCQPAEAFGFALKKN